MTENRVVGTAIKAATMPAAALALNPLTPRGWNGFAGFGRHISKHFVADDKRAAHKAHNRRR